MARLMALVANGGRLVVPHLAESAGLASLAGPEQHQQFATDGPAPPTTDFAEAPSAETLDWVRAGLAAVVADPHGTGYKTVRHDLVTIAGKTGTAEVGGGRADHAWFVGYAPADKPRVSFVVVLEHGGSGGKVAGPVARSLVQAMLELGIVRGAGEAAYAN
jgi:penicillin-binding protein 2